VKFVVHISSDKGKDVEDAKILKRYLVLQQYNDVFPTEILELPLHRELDLSIELVPGAASTSKAPYSMSSPELVELKLQLKEMLDKKDHNSLPLIVLTSIKYCIHYPFSYK